MTVVTDLDAVNRDVIKMMKRIYGDRLAAIILFGSYARGDFHDESDVDYLVVLDEDTVSAFAGVNRTSSLRNDYYRQTGITISLVVVSVRQFMTSSRPFFKEVRKDKKLIYERRPAYLFVES